MWVARSRFSEKLMVNLSGTASRVEGERVEQLVAVVRTPDRMGVRGERGNYVETRSDGWFSICGTVWGNWRLSSGGMGRSSPASSPSAEARPLGKLCAVPCRRQHMVRRVL